jgi:hypothetical protein
MDEYMVTLGDYEYAVEASSPEEARKKALLSHIKGVGQESVKQAETGAIGRRNAALGIEPDSPSLGPGDPGFYGDPNDVQSIIEAGRSSGTAEAAGPALGILGTSLLPANRVVMGGLGAYEGAKSHGLKGAVVGGGVGAFAPEIIRKVGTPLVEAALGASGSGGKILRGILSAGRGLETVAAEAPRVVEAAAPKVAAKAASPEVMKRLEIQAEKVAAARERNALLKRALDMKEAKLAAPKPGPRAVPEPAPAPRTEGATALKPDAEMIPDEAVSLVAEPLPFKPRAAKGTTTMGTNLGGKAKPGPAPTPPEKLEETLRASVEAAKAKKPTPATVEKALKESVQELNDEGLRVPRIEVGAQRVGRQVGMSKEEVRQAAGPVLNEARGAASPIFPRKTLNDIVDKIQTIPMPERDAYVRAATSDKAMWQVETIRRTLERLGLLLPVGVAAGAARE